MRSRSSLQNLSIAVIGLTAVGAPLGCCLEIVEGEALHTPSFGSATGTGLARGPSTSGSSAAATSSAAGGASSSGTASGTTGGSSSGTSTGGSSTGSLSSTGSAASSTGTTTGPPPDYALWIGGSGALTGTTLLAKQGDVAFDETCPSPTTSPPALEDGFEAVDGRGNLWTQAPSSQLYIWTPAQLAQSCASAMPAIGLAANIAGPIAFDSQGNLWTAEGTIVGYSASDLRAQSTGPSWAVAGDCGGLNLLCVASGLAFDSNGYLWVANLYSVLGFAPATLDQVPDAGEGNLLPSTPANLTLTTAGAVAYDGGTSGRYYGAYVFNNLAFDAAGNLWISAYDYQANPATHEIVEYTQAQLRNLAIDEAPTPALTIHETSAQQEQAFLGWVALAFDADGNLWAGSQPGIGPNLFRFSPASLAKSELPDVALTVPGDPSLSLAFSPIPAGLPIQP